MDARVALVIAIVLIAIAALSGFAHVTDWPRRRGVSGLPIVRTQRLVRRYGILVGIIEVAALIALSIVLLEVPVGSSAMWLAAAAALCVATMLGVWTAWLRPLNSTIAAWAPHEPPADWERHHQRWSRYHRARVALAIVALALLLMGFLARPAH